MRQKIKGACWNTTATTAEQSTIFSKGIKMMMFCSGFEFSSTNYNYWSTGAPNNQIWSETKSTFTQPCILYSVYSVQCILRLVCWSLGTWMTPFPLP